MSRKYTTEPGSDQVEKWKRAIADRNRQRRRDRWKRPQPKVTGYVVQPPAVKHPETAP